MRLDPKHLTFNQLSQGRLFGIPNYQRAYSWGTRQRNDLFQDIRDVQKSGHDHFMATVVCLIRDKCMIDADEFQGVDVVDGQQRLTTLIILIKAIEKALNSKDDKESKIKREICELLVKGDDFSLVLLQTNHDSSQIFLHYIRNGAVKNDIAKTAADQNLVNAIMECEKFVEEWKSSYSIIELVALIRNRLSFIYHELTDEAAVYRVFEVLNSRGLEVKWLDKFKSQLMSLIFAHADDGVRQAAHKEMQQIWHEIYGIIGLRIGLGDEALRIAGTLSSEERPNRILGQEDAARVLTAKAGIELRMIVEAAQWLCDVVKVVDDLDQNHRIKAVTSISHSRFLAAAIHLSDLKDVEKTELMQTWENVSFRIFGLARKDTRHKVGEYVRLAYDLFNSSLEEGTPLENIEGLSDGFSISEVMNNFDWSSCYNGWTEELRYLLYRYEEYLSAIEGEKLNTSQWNKIWEQEPSKSIEHITPQSSGLQYVHRLGNLTMLPPGVNSSLKDKKPTDKTKVYAKCGLRETGNVGRIISRNKGWKKANIMKREKHLEVFIRQEWA